MTTQHLDNATSGAILKSAQASAFVEVRHPKTLRLLARYNPTTREIEIMDSRRERHIVNLKEYDQGHR
jgi:hypothetical protein